MSNESNIRHGRRCVFQLHVHWVFVAKYRRRVLGAQGYRRSARHLRRRLLGRARHAGGDRRRRRPRAPTRAIHPKVALSSLVNSLKGVSSRLPRQQRPDIRKRYWKGVLWSPSYFASSCGGAPISIVRQYIEQQKTPN